MVRIVLHDFIGVGLLLGEEGEGEGGVWLVEGGALHLELDLAVALGVLNSPHQRAVLPGAQCEVVLRLAGILVGVHAGVSLLLADLCLRNDLLNFPLLLGLEGLILGGEARLTPGDAQIHLRGAELAQPVLRLAQLSREHDPLPHLIGTRRSLRALQLLHRLLRLPSKLLVPALRRRVLHALHQVEQLVRLEVVGFKVLDWGHLASLCIAKVRAREVFCGHQVVLLCRALQRKESDLSRTLLECACLLVAVGLCAVLRRLQAEELAHLLGNLLRIGAQVRE